MGGQSGLVSWLITVDVFSTIPSHTTLPIGPVFCNYRIWPNDCKSSSQPATKKNICVCVCVCLVVQAYEVNVMKHRLTFLANQLWWICWSVQWSFDDWFDHSVSPILYCLHSSFESTSFVSLKQSNEHQTVWFPISPLYDGSIPPG